MGRHKKKLILTIILLTVLLAGCDQGLEAADAVPLESAAFVGGSTISTILDSAICVMGLIPAIALFHVFKALSREDWGKVGLNIGLMIGYLTISILVQNMDQYGKIAFPDSFTLGWVDEQMGWSGDWLKLELPEGDQTPWTAEAAKLMLQMGPRVHSFYQVIISFVLMISLMLAVLYQSPNPMVPAGASLIGWIGLPSILSFLIKLIGEWRPENLVKSTLVQTNVYLILVLLVTPFLMYILVPGLAIAFAPLLVSGTGAMVSSAWKQAVDGGGSSGPSSSNAVPSGRNGPQGSSPSGGKQDKPGKTVKKGGSQTEAGLVGLLTGLLFGDDPEEKTVNKSKQDPDEVLVTPPPRKPVLGRPPLVTPVDRNRLALTDETDPPGVITVNEYRDPSDGKIYVWDNDSRHYVPKDVGSDLKREDLIPFALEVDPGKIDLDDKDQSGKIYKARVDGANWLQGQVIEPDRVSDKGLYTTDGQFIPWDEVWEEELT